MASHNPNMTAEEIKKANINRILKTTLILSVVTLIEFALAFLWPAGVPRLMLNLLFLGLTVVKAFYIVAEFMHLKYEVKFLAYAIVLPMLFVVWLVVALLREGTAMLPFYAN